MLPTRDKRDKQQPDRRRSTTNSGTDQPRREIYILLARVHHLRIANRSSGRLECGGKSESSRVRVLSALPGLVCPMRERRATNLRSFTYLRFAYSTRVCVRCIRQNSASAILSSFFFPDGCAVFVAAAMSRGRIGSFRKSIGSWSAVCNRSETMPTT